MSRFSISDLFRVLGPDTCWNNCSSPGGVWVLKGGEFVVVLCKPCHESLVIYDFDLPKLDRLKMSIEEVLTKETETT